MVRREVMYYSTDISGTFGSGTRLRIHYSVSNEVKKPVDAVLSTWATKHGYEKKGSIIYVRIRGIGGAAGRERAHDIEKEVRQIIRDTIRSLGYKPKLED